MHQADAEPGRGERWITSPGSATGGSIPPASRWRRRVPASPEFLVGALLAAASQLTRDAAHRLIVAPVTGSGCVGVLGEHAKAARFVEAEQFPADRFVARTATADLPDAHHSVAVGGDPDRVHFNDSDEAVVADLEAFVDAECAAGGGGMHGACVEFGGSRR